MKTEPTDFRIEAEDIHQPLIRIGQKLRRRIELGAKKSPQPADLFGSQDIWNE
jgi:hypothetical protein